MKRIVIMVLLAGFVSFNLVAQNKKADKEAAGKAQFDKAMAAIDAKDFVIIVDSYEASTGAIETNTDDANFLSYEKTNVFIQGPILFVANPYKMDVSDYKQELDKKQNLKVVMQVRGSLVSAKVEIYMKKGGNYADVIISPTKGASKRFSGEVVPRAESKYIKRSGVI